MRNHRLYHLLPFLAIFAGLPRPAFAGFWDTILNAILFLPLLFMDYLLEFAMWLLGILLSLAGRYIDLLLSVQNLAGAPTVIDGWTFVRDALNFVFILALLAIAFATIAGIEEYGIRRLLPRLLIAALLVNFSLAIAGAFIQVSNVLCTAALRSARGGIQAECGATFSGFRRRGGGGGLLSEKIAETSLVRQYFRYDGEGVISFFGVEAFGRREGPTRNVDPSNIPQTGNARYRNLQIILEVMMIVVIIALFAASMVALAIMLTIRAAALIILLVLAPVPYAFSVVPKLSEWGGKWWSSFLRYTFFLPAVVFFIVLAINVAGSGRPETGIFSQLLGPQGATAAARDPNYIFVAFNTLFISTFIVVSIFVARSLSLYGADAAVGYARRAVRGTALGGAKVAAVPGIIAGRAIGYGARGAARQIAAVPGISSLVSGTRAYRTGRALYTGEEQPDIVAEQQKAVKQYNEDKLKTLMAGGNAGAAAELISRGDLDNEQDFRKAISMLPAGSELREKAERSFGSALGVTQATGISSKSLKERVKSGAGVTPDEVSKFRKIAADPEKIGKLRRNIAKIKDEDVPKYEEQIYAALKASTAQLQEGETDLNKHVIRLDANKLRGYAERTSPNVQNALREYLTTLSQARNAQGEDLLTNALKKASRDRLGLELGQNRGGGGFGDGGGI